MSSTIDINIIQGATKNRRTITVSMDLSLGATKNVDLTNCAYGQLDFKPDDVHLKYIGYTSGQNAPYNTMPIVTCDFLADGSLLGPYLACTSINTFENLKFKVNQQCDIRHVTFTNNSITDEQGDATYNSGTVLICLEFVRYHRRSDF